MSYEFAKKEIGDYRITIYQDEDAECPCTEWDLAGVYFWDYSDYGYNRNFLVVVAVKSKLKMQRLP